MIMKTDNAQKQMTAGQQRELYIRVLAALPLEMPWKIAQRWIQNPKDLTQALSGILLPRLWDWQTFFQKYFSMELDLSDLKTPLKQEGFDRLIIVPKGMTPNRIYEACAKHFPCWKWTEDLNETVAHNDREPKETYAIWVRNRKEADEENKNISAEQAKEQKIQGITLDERLMFELKYWDETGEHLDVENLTICSGSRFSAGHVPRVGWDDGELSVRWCRPQHARSPWRVRTVVSFQS